MLFEALRDSVRYPTIWLAGVVFAAVGALQLVLTVQGEPFFSVRLLVLEYLILPFMLAGAYGVLREADSAPLRLISEGVANYFRVLLPALVVAFAATLLLFALFIPLSIIVGAPSTDLAAGLTIAILVPVAVLFSLYDTAACFEGLGVFASLRRSVALALAHVGEVVVFLLTTLAVLVAAGFLLLVGWTTVLYAQLEPLTTMPPAEVATFGPSQFAAMIGPVGIALAALGYGLFMLFAFVFVTTYKARVFRSVSAATPPTELVGEYDEKGRYYRY